MAAVLPGFSIPSAAGRECVTSLVREPAAPRDGAEPGAMEIATFLGMPAVVASEPMRELLRFVRRVAPTSAAVLITGESGTGKELVARAIHQYSLRSTRPWVDVNCAALPDHLVESELFGYEKGAFSGADSVKPGLFEVAHGGTLFLDEIGELDRKLQVKLLRVLDGVPYYRLGSVRKTSVDVRIVAATNASLEEAVREGRFRSDLYHRLHQLHVAVPPLRERPEDIEALAAWFVRQQDPRLRVPREFLDALRSYSWPGNVRELRNVMTRAAVLAEGGRLAVAQLPEEMRRGEVRPVPSPFRLESLEQGTITKALARTGGRQDRAAELLGISRRTLIRKIKAYGLERRPAPDGAPPAGAAEITHAPGAAARVPHSIGTPAAGTHADIPHAAGTTHATGRHTAAPAASAHTAAGILELEA